MKGKLTRGRRKIQMLHNLANDDGYVPRKRLTRMSTRLATANRLCISICGRHCKHFPLIQLHHHAQFDFRFSHCVHASKRLKNLTTLGPHPTRIGVWLPMCYCTKFRRSRSNHLSAGRGPKNSGGRWGPVPPPNGGGGTGPEHG